MAPSLFQEVSSQELIPEVVSMPAGAPATSSQRVFELAQSAVSVPSSPLAGAVMDQVIIDIRKNFKEGVDRISIQLKPESLGKVDISLDLTPEGKSIVVVSTERADTLTLLKQNTHFLAQSLEESGFHHHAIDYHLMGESFSREQNHQGSEHADGYGKASHEGASVSEPSFYQPPLLPRHNGAWDIYV
jgi:flagellar hook-length control protein FliK